MTNNLCTASHTRKNLKMKNKPCLNKKKIIIKPESQHLNE